MDLRSKLKLKGYSLSLLATVAGSTVYVFSKAALNEVSLAQFGVYWFALAILFNFLYTLRSPKTREFKLIPKSSLRILLMMGLIEIVATGTFYAAIAAAPNPAIPSFLRNAEYMFVTLFGILLLRERFSGIEIIGVLLTFTGVLVISYSKGGNLAAYLTGSSGLMMVCTAFYAARTLLAKRFIRTLSPSMLAINRAIFLMMAALIWLVVSGQSLKIPSTALLYLVVGSFLGPFMTSQGQYGALKYIEASRAAIVQSTTALFTVLGVFIYFSQFPPAYQIAGGLLTVVGVILVMVGRRQS